ncbi:MAG: hypothetical protein HY852_20750 [Bradyrhizobium sp.]|uniref:hypothetical protein n=1 Tax=Bradyrhizobium sp. TaxID=376 RepID=UPI0025B862E8|nr:hypothetical protein [Bradyrhizobium sp.]MBI5264239.1 hypothetical protein [Bradyrhizobium sp.]
MRDDPIWFDGWSHKALALSTRRTKILVDGKSKDRELKPRAKHFAGSVFLLKSPPPLMCEDRPGLTASSAITSELSTILP